MKYDRTLKLIAERVRQLNFDILGYFKKDAMEGKIYNEKVAEHDELVSAYKLLKDTK